MRGSTYNHTLFILGGDLWGCGKNSCGELGLGHTDDVNEFTRVDSQFDGSGVKDVRCGNYFSLILTYGGNLFVSGDNTLGQLGIKNLTRTSTFTQLPLYNVESIECSKFFSGAIVDGRLFLWGSIVKRPRNIKIDEPTEVINDQFTKVFKLSFSSNIFLNSFLNRIDNKCKINRN